MYFHTYLSGWLGQNIIKNIRVKLFSHMQSFKLKFFDKTPIGRIVTRNVSDIETIADIFGQGVAAIIGDILLLFGIVFLMFLLNWKLTLISLSTLPLLLFTTYIFKEKVKVSFNEVRDAVANLNSYVQEHIVGMKVVQIFGNEKKEQYRFDIMLSIMTISSIFKLFGRLRIKYEPICPAAPVTNKIIFIIFLSLFYYLQF